MILAAADSTAVRRFVTAHGMRLGAARFVAGETADEFLAVARRVNGDGFAVAAGILGEGTRDESGAREATDQYCALLQRFRDEGLDANVALKVTHLGLDLSPELALQNVRTVARRAADCENTMRLDMEQSSYVDATLAIYRTLRVEGFPNVGFVLQAYLYRSMADLEALLPLGSNVRIVKGAYLEPKEVAFQEKREVDENYARLVERALMDGGYTAIATHDAALIERAVAFAERRGVPKHGRFEFQTLYGVASPLAKKLLARGYRVRLAVPYGEFWFPYLMRRLAERPANVAFFLKNLLERDGG
ncbi:MAG: proline dehydrogenase family protein [Candidatus Eremiobacteraeota bacterium]|nr:proline dehydrogenase family protein [Candidatus Eremiobacteraeota bacterium]